jgi:cysteine desulfurase
MHGNNEVGNLLQIEKVSALCKEQDCGFYTDAVQTIGHYQFDLSSLYVSGLAASAHKFHGPKGVGFLYLKQGTKLSGIYHGGSQERGLSVGTENVAGIVGMAKALEISHLRHTENNQHIALLKRTMIDLLVDAIPNIQFNGASANLTESIDKVLSVSFPMHEKNEMLMFNLDLADISVSAGSACASGAATESHVLKTLKHDKGRRAIRFSFSRLNTLEELQYVAKKLSEILT